MIIVRLKGGLGNQMFQYAAGRRLAYHHGASLKIDVTFYDDTQLTPKRHFDLENYGITWDIASRMEIARLSHVTDKWLNKVLYRIQRKGRKYPYSYYKEAGFGFDERVLSLPDNIYIDGYWQSQRYFSDIETLLRSELKPVACLTENDDALIEVMSGVQSVSLHVRRGDYVNISSTSGLFNCLGTDYYIKAVSYMAERFDDPVFFLFSDDPDWVQNNLRLPYKMIVVSSAGENRSSQDLWLMSLCKHHIIANSTFSWWGAWLNPDSGKIVVAPRMWFKDESRDTNDLIPAGWVVL